MGQGLFKVIENGAFDRSYTTFYWSAIVNRPIALSCTVFELFDVE